jgi:hypothetical protein
MYHAYMYHAYMHHAYMYHAYMYHAYMHCECPKPSAKMIEHTCNLHANLHCHELVANDIMEEKQWSKPQ